MPPPPPPLPSQDVDFGVYIYTSTPFFATAPTQLPPPTPAFSGQRAQSEVEPSMSPPPLFIGSEGGFAEMEPDLDVDVLPIASQEVVDEVNLGVEEEEAELILPELSRREVVETVKALMEIPDSDEESEASSPVKKGSVVRDEGLDVKNGLVEEEEDDVLIENGSIVGQEDGRSEEPGGGDDGERMNDQDGNTVSLRGIDGDVRVKKLDDPSTNEMQELTASEIFPLDSHLNDEDSLLIEDVDFVQPATVYEPQNMMLDDQIDLSVSTAIEDQPRSFDKSHHLHLPLPHSEQGDHGEPMATTALQKAQHNTLGALHDAENAVEDSTSSGRPEPMGLDLESARLDGDKAAASPINERTGMQVIRKALSPPHVEEELHLREPEKELDLSLGNCTDDLGQSGNEELCEVQQVTNINEESVENNPENKSCTSTLDKEISKLLSAETEITLPMECVPIEDEVSLIPTENSSQVKNSSTEDSVTLGEPEDVVMEDIPLKETPAIGDSPVIEDLAPRATRRKSSRKSDETSDMTPKQGRRASARGKSQLESEVAKPQPTIESSAINLDNSTEVAEVKTSSHVSAVTTPGMKSEGKPTRKASSTRKKSGRGSKAEEVPTVDPITATIQNNEEDSHENSIVLDPAAESQISIVLPKKAPATRRKSQRGTKTEEVVLIRADTPASLEENDETIEKDTVMTPAPELLVEVPTRKKSQRKPSSASRKASGTSTKRQREDEPEEQPEIVADTISTSLPVPAITASKSPEPQKPAVSQRPLLPSREGSQSKDVLIAELKAMKIASIQARTASLEAEIAAKRAKVKEITKELTQPAAETVKRHIKLLHDYNDIRDVGQALVGMIADNRGVRIGELYDEFGVGLKD